MYPPHLKESPLTFFRVTGGPTEMGCNDPPNKHDQPAPTCTNVTRQGLQVRGAALYNIQCIGIEICTVHGDMDIFTLRFGIFTH